MAAMVLFSQPACAQRPPLELAVKATYLYKLAPFVTWPPQAFDSPADPLVICVQGDDPFGPVLDRAVAGQHLGRHAIVVRRIARLDRGSGCHIAYLAGSAAQPPAAALSAVAGAPVLTVTDADRNGARGIVHFTRDRGRVRFAIDARSAADGRLAISSKLLALATSVAR
jgi:hypothetical protein